MQRLWARLGLLAAIAAGAATPAAAQDVTMTERAPRFLVAASEGPVPVDVGRTPVLRRRISLALRDVPLGEALDAIARESGLRLGYSRTVVPVERTVRLVAEDITVAGALAEVLFDTGVDVLFDRQGLTAALVRREARVERAVPGAVVGRVTDAGTGRALLGAEVVLDGTRWRTASGENGFYRLSDVDPGSYTLTVRRIGYGKRSQAVAVVSEREVTVDMALEPMPTQLNEVVVTATGEQRLRELGHVVGRINADSLVKEAPVSSVTELLSARVPGLLVQTRQGTVGGDVSLQIRSATSIRLRTEPIVIVDGVRYTTNPRGIPEQGVVNFGPFDAEPTSRLNDLNPNDIESIEVVKGPSAATLYGTDAANGVIVITTKRGRPGPARWSAYARTSLSEIPRQRYPDIYWGWSKDFFGDSTYAAVISCGLRYQAAGYCTQDSVTTLPSTLNDPALSIFATKPRWEYGANVAGGRQDLRYYFSADIEDATGPIQVPPGLIGEIQARRGVRDLPEELREPNTLSRVNLRSTVGAGLGQRAELRVAAGYTQSATRTLTLNGNPFGGAFLRNPTQLFDSTMTPEDAFSQTSTERINRFVGSASGEWRPWVWLQTRGTLGVDLTSSNRYSLARPGDAPRSSHRAGTVGDDRARYLVTTADLGATASFRLGRVSSRTAVGAQYVRSLYDALMSHGRGLPPGGSTIGQAQTVSTSQSYHEAVTLGGYLEQTVGLNDRLFVTGALRMDGASGFGRQYDAAFYSKAGVSWILSEEPLLPRVPGLDELRVRYAFGASGQQPLPLWQRRTFLTSPYVADGQMGNVLVVTGVGNPELRPERVREHEFGLDAAALRGRVRLDLTWSHRRTVDQLTTAPLPAGFGVIYTNLGRIDGYGFEAQLTLRPLDSRFVSWDVTVHHSWQTNTVVDLTGGLPEYSTFGGYAEGYPTGARFAYPLRDYTDANGDGIIEANEVQLGDSMVYVGRSIPPRTQTLSTTVGLFRRRLRLSALLDRQSGFLQFDRQQLTQCNAGLCRAAVDPATPLAEQAVLAAIEAGVGGYRYVPMEPGDFTRLREVTVAFDVPDRLVRAMRVSRVSLSISARNLAVWTAYGGADPESSATFTAMPQARAWAFRLDIGF